MNICTYIQLDDDIPAKPPVKAANAPAYKPPAYVPIFQYPVNIKKLRSQIMVDSTVTGWVAEGIIKHNLTMSMMKELESHIRIEKMQDGFSVYGQTMFIGKLDVVENK